MRIQIQTTLLAATDLAAGIVGPSELALNGRQLVDEADFFGAAYAAFYARGNASVQLQFSVERLFGSARQAQAFALAHCRAIPLEGLVQCTAGEGGDTQTLFLRDAVVDAVQVSRVRGRSVRVGYTITGPQWEGDVPPEEIPGEPEPGEEFVVMRRGRVAIASGAESVAVVFSSPLAAVPVVTPTIGRPTGSPSIGCSLREDSVTVNGFTVDLDAATPDASYVLHYTAIE